jgi:hypothetical protein
MRTGPPVPYGTAGLIFARLLSMVTSGDARGAAGSGRRTSGGTPPPPALPGPPAWDALYVGGTPPEETLT